jgi:L-galactose dehydrogenase
MERRRFGRTGLQVSVVGLGTGGPSQLGQTSGVPESEAHRVVRRALDLGINLMDTAAQYRESEAILGRALAGVPRDRYVMCTKFNPVAERGAPPPGTPKAAGELAASLERSLRRLQTDYVDVFQLHGVHPSDYPMVRDRFIPEMKRLQEQGKIRFLGITSAFPGDDPLEMLGLALADDLWDTIMVGYNLLTLTAEAHVLPEAQRRDVGVLIMCAVRRAIARPERLTALIRELKERGELAPGAVSDDGPLDWLVHDDVPSVTAAAYRYVAGHPAVSCVLTGTANLHHLEENVRDILAGPLPAADRQRVQSLFGHIRRNLGN